MISSQNNTHQPIPLNLDSRSLSGNNHDTFPRYSTNNTTQGVVFTNGRNEARQPTKYIQMGPQNHYVQMPPQNHYVQMPPQNQYAQMPPQNQYAQMPPQNHYAQMPAQNPCSFQEISNHYSTNHTRLQNQQYVSQNYESVQREPNFVYVQQQQQQPPQQIHTVYGQPSYETNISYFQQPTSARGPTTFQQSTPFQNSNDRVQRNNTEFSISQNTDLQSQSPKTEYKTQPKRSYTPKKTPPPETNNQAPKLPISLLKELLKEYADSVFVECDDNKSDFLDRYEIIPAMTKVFQMSNLDAPSDDQVLNIMKTFDKDGNGLLDKKEFRELVFTMNGLKYDDS
jgi:hypothetical protein